ncbi:peripheral myelin protein 22-like isoform X2 [Heptranchias perlo]|uniref:peripheral myelin protein 22-like isoform X2 n=1 Tax=Heptranchias perlo TaxID=212740 RepID=UPI00355A425E
MYLLLPSLLILHLADLLLLYISTIDNTWWMYKEGKTGDLWQQCSYSDAERTWICGSAMVTSGGEWQHAVQALMVLAVLFSSLSFLIFVCQLYTLRRGSLFYVTGLFQIFSGGEFQIRTTRCVKKPILLISPLWLFSRSS